MTQKPLQAQFHAAERDDTWYAFDAPYRRLRLFSTWSIAGFGLAVGVGLTLGYPYQSLEEQLASSERHGRTDRLTVEYLKVFLDAEPEAYSLRVQLVRKLMQLGSFAEARIAMLPLERAGARWRRQAAWLELDIREQEAFARPEGSRERAERVASLQGQLALLLRDTQDAGTLLRLAQKALAIQDQETAAVALRRLANASEKLEVPLYAQAAEAALGLNDYRTSAGLYFRAMEQSRSFDDMRRYFLDGLRVLQSGGLFLEAVAEADRHIGPLSEDRDTLLFLARLAQSGNMLDAAQRYALRLLKLSLLRQLEQPQIMQASWSVFPDISTRNMRRAMQAMITRTAGAADAGKGPALLFDEEAYELGYKIFVANRNLPDARRVAESAVRQRPASPVWRRRLAEVSEWSNLPREALPQWLEYARMTGDEVAWDNGLRLAESLHDIEATTAALRHKLAIQPDSQAWLDRLLSAYEYAGEPQRGLQTLKARLAVQDARMTAAERERELVLLARLSERTGRNADALDAWTGLQREFGPKSGYGLAIAVLLSQRGQVRQAYEALKAAAVSAQAEDEDFWRAYAELARLLQEDDVAIAGYRKLLGARAESEADLFSLIALLESDRPMAAARAAMYGFAKTGGPRFALLALNASMRAGDANAALRFLRSIPGPKLETLRQDPGFLAGRASVLQATGDLAGAERDLRAALSMQSNNSQYRSGLIWLLIARRDAPSLKRALLAWTRDAENDAVMWGPFAAAYMAINRQGDALHWFRKPGFPRDDYLWLMSYAEALEANSQPDLAWRIRRHVWLELRKPEVLKQTDPESLKALRDRLAAVAPLFMDGDAATTVLQALLRADLSTVADVPLHEAPSDGRELAAELDRLAASEPPVSDSDGSRKEVASQESASLLQFLPQGAGRRPGDDVRLSAAVRELALAYALNREAHDLARAWLASRFAQQLARPMWAELSLALAANDRQRLERLLDELPDWLPMYDRIEAAQRTGRPELAQTLAFDQMVHLPHDEELHARFTDLVSARPPGVEIGFTELRQSPLSRTELATKFHTDVAPRLKLSLGIGQARQSSLNEGELRDVPAADRTIEAGMRMDGSNGTVSATVHHRSAAREFAGLRLAYAISAGSKFELATTLGMNQAANETALLRVGGTRSGIDTAATYAFSKAEYMRFGFGWQRYGTQAGTNLGSGGNWNLEAGTHLRSEYPSLTMRTFVSGGRYSPRGSFDNQIARLLPAGIDPASYRFLPEDDRLVGISLGVGTAMDNRYTRAWRPFGDVGTTYSRVAGAGFNFSAGVAGSVFGSDTLQLRVLRSAGTPTSPNGFRELGLNYIWLY
jgi:hypothetical protein